jgi:predicted permease
LETFFQLIKDLRYGVRALRRTPGFTLTSVAVLALAIGANTAIFSVIEAVLLRPLPYRDSARLAMLWKTVPARGIDWDWTSGPTVFDWRDQRHLFEDFAVLLRPEASQVAWLTDAGPETVQSSKVLGGFFDILAVPPLLGRSFSRDEAERGANVTVLSYGFWQGRCGADRNILGRTLQLDGQNTTVIGVMPPRFQFPDKAAQLWLPLASDSRWPLWEQSRFRIADAFSALVRLKPGVSMAQARADMTSLSERLARQYPATDAGLGVRVVYLFDQIAGSQTQRALWVLEGAVFCVLLIACSNIAGLQVARGMAQRKELAVRAALGAGRGRLLWQLVIQNLLLFFAGGAAGLAIAAWGLRAMPLNLPRADGIEVDVTVLLFTVSLCLLTGVVSGLLPALRIVGTDLRADLFKGGRVRAWLVAPQFALAVTLLSGAGLLLRSFVLLSAVSPGFDTSHLLTVRVRLPESKYNNEQRTRTFFDEAERRISALPGVREASVGSASFGIFSGQTPNESIVTEDRQAAPDQQRHERDLVGDDYFRALGVLVARGRTFSSQDQGDGPAVAVINQTMARRFWPAENPIGKRFKEVLRGQVSAGKEGAWVSVIGVVSDSSRNRDGSVVPTFYRPFRQWPLNRMDLVVRTEGDPSNLLAAVQQAMRSTDASLPLFDISTVRHDIRELDRPRRFQAMSIGIFAGMALTLAALGLYGLMSYSVEQHRREIGIRVAIGARPSDVTRLILGEGILCTLAGSGAGIAGALAFGRVLSASLFGITPADPTTLAAVIAVLGMVMACVCATPLWRAMRIDPVVALRQD